MPFPLPIVPSVPWRNVQGSRATHFGAPRTEINPKTGQPYPPHGACDLIAPAKTPVLAVADGTVWYRGWFYDSVVTDRNPSSRHFGEVTCRQQLYELTVLHYDAKLSASYVARYGEIAPDLPPGMGRGDAGVRVTAGQVIAYVGLNCANEQMLHFEMFGEVSRRDSLTVSPTPRQYKYVPWLDYQRRDDLLDPTLYLDCWAKEMVQQQALVKRAELRASLRSP